ncbi:hypothetical protein RSAG8_01405, partial [Rhizoctonia solani AG-8 WAC10335]
MKSVPAPKILVGWEEGRCREEEKREEGGWGQRCSYPSNGVR